MPITQRRMKSMIDACLDWRQAAKTIHLQLEVIARKHPEILSGVDPLEFYLKDISATITTLDREIDHFRLTVRQNDYRRKLRGGGSPNAPQHSIFGPETDSQFATSEQWSGTKEIE